MATKKKQVGVYLDKDIENWYKSLPEGLRTKVINSMLRYAVAQCSPDLIDSSLLHDKERRELGDMCVQVGWKRI